LVDSREIGKRLVRYRGSRTQKEVSDAVGVSVSSIAMYEAGKRMPRDDKKAALAQYYGTTVESIFFAGEYTHSELINRRDA
jgi:putative transcriptional regulator